MEVINKMNEKQLQDKINGTIWSACDTLRSSIPGANYKDYALVMLFVKYLSDTYKEEKEIAAKRYDNDPVMIERYLSRGKFKLTDDCTFDYLYENRNDNEIGAIINKALEKISTLNGVKLLNLFAGVDFNSEIVFGKMKEKNAILRTLLQDFHNDDIDLRPSKIGNLDVIGNAYEYLIARFAGDSGKKGGEFYTPAEVSTLLAKLVAPKENDRVYDPACGSGSLLLKAAKEVPDKKVSVYGQESNSSTYNLCRMNMFLHGVNDAHIEWGDTLANPLHLEHDDLMKFDVIVSNPPFSLDKWAKGFESHDTTITEDGKRKDTFKMEASLDPYNRFEYGVPPKSIGDYAFIQHMLKSLAEDGRMAVVLPHGALFRGASEGIIRQRILENNLIDAVIGLPENLFYGVSIPATIVVFKKNREHKDVLFIEASREYEKGKNQNRLTDNNIQKILETYLEYKEIEKYSHVATIDEIKENEYNLNIKRYVDTFEEEEEIDIEETKKNIAEIEKELQVLEKELQESLKELGL
jgi:type I restriction enzyme M protein